MSEPRVIWYEDSTMMAVHRQLVKAGMEKARQEGKHIGRPRVTERPEFIESYHTVLMQIREGTLSRRKAARQLDIGYATLKRLSRCPAGVGRTTRYRSIAYTACGCEIMHW